MSVESKFPPETQTQSIQESPEWRLASLEAENSKLEDRVRDLENKNKELFELAYKDRLTGLWNRNGLQMRLEQNLFGRPEKKGGSISLLILDIDKFKSINDTFGHPVGDQVLAEIGRALEKEVRSTDIVARWGGEEIVIVFQGADEKGVLEKFHTKTADDEAKSSKGRARFTRTIGVEGRELKVTLSGGVTNFDPAQETYDDAFKRADLALYKAKGKDGAPGEGRDRILGVNQIKKQELRDSMK